MSDHIATIFTSLQLLGLERRPKGCFHNAPDPQAWDSRCLAEAKVVSHWGLLVDSVWSIFVGLAPNRETG